MDYLVALKAEQSSRITMRETALYVHLGAIFAVLAAEGQAGSNNSLRDIIICLSSCVTLVMFSIYLSNDYYITLISRYCMQFPDPSIQRWESERRKNFVYFIQKNTRIVIVILAFVGWQALVASRISEMEFKLAHFINFISVSFTALITISFISISYRWD